LGLRADGVRRDDPAPRRRDGGCARDGGRGPGRGHVSGRDEARDRASADPMTLETWALFAVTETALSLTPGPAVLLVLSQGLTRGTAPSVYANLGILTGNAFYFALSATGLGAVLLASYELFSLVRWLGAAYLIWLGVRALAGRRAARSLAPGPTGAAGRRRTFVNGFVLQTANPK